MSSIDSSAPAICSERTTPPISISAVWSKPFGAGLMTDGETLSKVTVSLLSLARLRPASMRTAFASTSAIEAPFRRRCASTAMCFAALAKGTPRARPDKRAVGVERDAILRACGRDRHLAFGRGNLRLRQQPSGQHGLGERHRDRMPSGGADDAKTFGEARAGTAEFLSDPRQRQAGLAERLPERRFPLALLVAVDCLRVGEIGKDLLCGLDDDVLTLRHGVPRLIGLARPTRWAVHAFSCAG